LFSGGLLPAIPETPAGGSPPLNESTFFMYKYIWLVPLLPLAGAALNGIFGRRFGFSEKLIGGIAVASVALSFLISLTAVYSYGFGGNAQWPNPYVTTQTAFNWIPAGAVKQTLGQAETSTTISVAT